MRKEKQLGFEILEDNATKHFGGAYLKNSNAKVKRPISTKKSMHLVLRSSQAKGKLSLSFYERKIHQIILNQGRLHGVKVYRQANGGNHLHLIVLPRSRKAFQSFIRAISGLIARLVLNVERGPAEICLTEKKYRKENVSVEENVSAVENKSVDNHSSKKLRFWDQRPFTKIIEWGREFKAVTDYLTQNTLEAMGFITYRLRRYKQCGIESTA